MSVPSALGDSSGAHGSWEASGIAEAHALEGAGDGGRESAEGVDAGTAPTDTSANPSDQV